MIGGLWCVTFFANLLDNPACTLCREAGGWVVGREVFWILRLKRARRAQAQKVKHPGTVEGDLGIADKSENKGSDAGACVAADSACASAADEGVYC